MNESNKYNSDLNKNSPYITVDQYKAKMPKPNGEFKIKASLETEPSISFSDSVWSNTGENVSTTPTTTPAGVPNKGPQGTRRAKGFTGRGNVQQPQVPPENIQRETIMQAKEINNDQKFPGWFTQTEIDEAGNKSGRQLQEFIDGKNLERAKGLAAQDPQLLKEITGTEIPADQVGTMGGNAALAAGAQAVTQEQANKYLAKSGTASSGQYNVNAE